MNAIITIIQPDEKKNERADIVPVDWNPDEYRPRMYVIDELGRFMPGSIFLN